MLIGYNNNINLRLAEEINTFLFVHIVDCQKFLNHELIPEKRSPQVIFVNLIDVGNQEREVYKSLKESYPDSKLIALHYYQTPSMMKNTLIKGYDGYLSIFKFSDKLYELLEQLSIKLSSE